ncbi:MAG: class I SAM-dependent methyltransferase [candidate division NC10 bacterium]
MVKRETLARCVCCGSDSFVSLSDTVKAAQCRGCGVIFNYERPAWKDEPADADAYVEYDRFRPDHKWEKMWRFRYARVQALFPPTPARPRLLDVGTGIGTFLALAREQFDVCGVEPSLAGVRKARELYGLEILHGSLEGAGYPEKSFDAITMWHVFEHLPYPGDTLGLCRRLLKQDGKLFIAVPNSSLCRVILNPAYWCARQDKRLAMRGVIPYEEGMVDLHVTHHAPRSLKRLLERFGFQVMDLDLDKTSLNPGLKTDLKYVVRHHFIRLFGCNPFKTIVAVARAV